MELKQIKEHADKFIGLAQGMMIRDKFFNPVIFAVSEKSTTPVSLNVENDSDVEMVSELMAELAPTCSALIFVMDSYTIEVDKDKVKEVPENLKDNPESSQALVCLIHMKGASSLRQIRYSLKDDWYSWFDLGWDDINDIAGRFKNPFDKK